MDGEGTQNMPEELTPVAGTGEAEEKVEATETDDNSDDEVE